MRKPATPNRATIVVLILISLVAGFAAEAKSAGKVPGALVNSAVEPSTRHSFSGSRVNGQYQVPAEATAQIENEKPLEELLGLRTQFRDRMKQDTERR